MGAPDARHSPEVFHVLVGVRAWLRDRLHLRARIANPPLAARVGIGVGPTVGILVVEDRKDLEPDTVIEGYDDHLAVSKAFGSRVRLLDRPLHRLQKSRRS